MLGVEEVFNNGGLLDVRFSQDLAEVSIIKKLEKTTDNGEKFYVNFFSDGTAEFGCCVRGKWWSSNSQSINEVFCLHGTEWELQYGSFAVNSRSCGITKVIFEKLDKEFNIMDRFSRQKRSCASSSFFSC